MCWVLRGLELVYVHVYPRACENSTYNGLKMFEQLYHLVSINNKTKSETLLTETPITQSEALIMREKFTVHDYRRIELQEWRVSDAESGPGPAYDGSGGHGSLD